VGKGASVRARGRVWPRRRLDARRYPLTFSVPPRRRVRDSFHRAKRRSRSCRRFSRRVGDSLVWAFQSVFFRQSARTSRCASALRRRHSCRHCPSAHAAVAPGSPRVHRARWARKPKENTAWVRVPCPRRRTAPRPSRHPPFPRNRRRRRRLSGDDAPTTRATTSEQPERRVRYKTRPRSFPRRRVSASIARASRRLSLSPSTRARHHERATAPLATPTLTTAALSFVPNPQTSSTTWRRSRATARARRSSSCN
jgi:hypothetical protein